MSVTCAAGRSGRGDGTDRPRDVSRRRHAPAIVCDDPHYVENRATFAHRRSERSRAMSDISVGAVDAASRSGPIPPTRVLLVEDDEGDAFLVRELLIDAARTSICSGSARLARRSAVLPGRLRLRAARPRPARTRTAWMRCDCRPQARAEPRRAGADRCRRRVPRHRVGLRRRPGLSRQGQHRRRAAASAPIRYAVERKRADESMRRLFASEARAAENARLERGLLPQPLVAATRCRSRRALPPRPAPGAAGRRLLRRRRARRTAHVFLLIGDVAGPRPRRGGPRRLPADRLAHPGARRGRPETILPAMDAVLASERSPDEVFATVTMVRVDPTAGTAAVLAAPGTRGRCSSTAVRPSPAEGDAGVALGVDRRRRLGRRRRTRRPAGRLLLFTDGLVEGYDGPRPGGAAG